MNTRMLVKVMSALFILVLLVTGCAAPAATAPTAAPAATTAPAATEAPAATTAPAATEAPAATTAPAATEAPAATTAPAAAAVTLSYLVDDSQNSQDTAKAYAEGYMALHPNVTINIESRPGGTEGDNVVKTRLATGDMTDVFWYNSGSLLQALKPSETLVDLTKEPFIANISDAFLPSVTQNGQIFGVPSGTGMGGGILYNKKIYEQLGLQVPKTWAEFEANNEKIKAAGIAPVIQTYGDTWTSQLFVLGDFYNVAQAVPNFAADYTANKAKYATTPAAMAGFTYLRRGLQQGLVREGFRDNQVRPGLEDAR